MFKGKCLALCLVTILAVTSLLIVLPTKAQTIPKPSVPEFTLQIVSHPYDVPTTTSIDTYSGEEIIHQGYHVENNSIQVKIKNQAFNPIDITENENSWTTNLNYNVRIKGHFAEQSQDWIELYQASDGYPQPTSGLDYTIISYTIGVNTHTFLGTRMIDLKGGDKVDFQVETMSGYIHREATSIPGSGWVFTGETSGWSSTQTVTIPATNSPNPTVPEFPITATLIVVLAAVSLLLVIGKRKQKFQH
jgi:hypothetical protein